MKFKIKPTKKHNFKPYQVNQSINKHHQKIQNIYDQHVKHKLNSQEKEKVEKALHEYKDVKHSGHFKEWYQKHKKAIKLMVGIGGAGTLLWYMMTQPFSFDSSIPALSLTAMVIGTEEFMSARKKKKHKLTRFEEAVKNTFEEKRMRTQSMNIK
jgi:uncharacterized FAD-dependent dehydrogenase